MHCKELSLLLDMKQLKGLAAILDCSDSFSLLGLLQPCSHTIAYYSIEYDLLAFDHI